MGILIQAKESDLEEIFRLEQKGFEAGIVEEKQVFQRRIQLFPEGFQRFCLSAQGPAVGYFCCEIWGEDVSRSLDREKFALNHDISRYHTRKGTVLYIASMTLDPSVRGKGSGHELFEKGLAAMREAFPQLQKALLLVNEHWNGARAIYSKAGFHEIGSLEEFFFPTGRTPEAAILMEKIFSGPT